MELLKLPPMGLGTWQLKPADCEKAVLNAIEIGYRFIDTAQAYRNEQAVGDGVVAALNERTIDRRDLIIATKVFIFNYAPKRVKKSMEISMAKLKLDYVDIVYIHWPTGAYNPRKTLPALAELVDQGQIRYIGVSNFTPPLLDEALAVCSKPIVANQIETHPLLQQRVLREYLKNHQIYHIAYSPLARGLVNTIPELMSVAQKHDVTPNQVALAWSMAHEMIPIPKATSKEHLEANYAAQQLKLDPSDMAIIDQISREKRLLNPIIAPKW